MQRVATVRLPELGKRYQDVAAQALQAFNARWCLPSV